ncbi:MAG: cell division protein DivIVA [Terracoccus sp.]
MKWVILFAGVVVLCLVVAVLLGLVTGGMGRATSTLSHEPLPDEAVIDDDFDDLVFDVSPRGYRMSQVDATVDRLRRELRERDEEIAVLRGAGGGTRAAWSGEDGFEEYRPAGETSDPTP